MAVDYTLINTARGPIWSSLSVRALASYVRAQIGAVFPDGHVLPPEVFETAAAEALAAAAAGWKRIAIAGYTRDRDPVFSHVHGDQYAAVLALLAQRLSRTGDKDLATRAYLLNKALHGLDIFHEVELPEVFVFVHPVGSVIGRARLGNFLCVYQNCSIGGSPRDGSLNYPVLGEGVLMYAGAAIIGKSTIGNRVVLAARASVVNADVPDGALVTGALVAGASAKAGHPNVGPLLTRIFNGLT